MYNDRTSIEIYRKVPHTTIETPFGKKPLINADSTASGYHFETVEQFISANILPFYSNTHSNAMPGQLMNYYISLARDEIRHQINAGDGDDVVFCGNGCTGAINMLIHLMGLTQCPDDLEIITSIAEHHSNYLAWAELDCPTVTVDLGERGIIDRDRLAQLLRKRRGKPTIVTLSAASNVTGVIQPTGQINRLVHRYGGLIFWDYAASAPYVEINVNRDPATGDYADAIFFSPHKFLGGPGSPGVLVAKRYLSVQTTPSNPGGGTVRFVCSRYRQYYDQVQAREPGGTPNIIGCIRAGLAFVAKRKYMGHIQSRNQWLTGYVQARLLAMDGLELLNPVENIERLPIFAFRIPPLHYNLTVVLLSDLFGIATRGGVSCCSLLAQRLLHCDERRQDQIYDSIVSGRGVPADYGWTRVSFHFAMPRYVVDYILDAIDIVVKYGVYWRNSYKYTGDTNCWRYKAEQHLGKEWSQDGQRQRAAQMFFELASEIPDTGIVSPRSLRDNIRQVNRLSETQKRLN